MKFYNTLTRKKEEFRPLEDNTVRMYSCGPTVYNFAHIGNMRAYVFMDILRRVLKNQGYQLMGVMNITDVGHLVSDADCGEDKMAKAAREQKKTPLEIAAFFTDVFKKDIAALNITLPELVPLATAHIGEMIAFVEDLLKKGYAYETSDGIYFDIEKYGKYGQLSGINLEDQLAGARVDVNDEKRHPADFALWKHAPKEHIMQWPSPWGMGYPGWHIECSAMSRKYLGEVFDIHTGGVDHIPVHHENEIAQSQALTGKVPARFWMHNEFMMVDNGKMSKSLCNTYTVANLQERGFHPLAFRYLCLNAHYRNKLNFTWEGMRSAQISYERLLDSVAAHKGAPGTVSETELAQFEKQFQIAITDDLNIPKALGVLWSMLRCGTYSDAVYQAALRMDEVLGLRLSDGPLPKEEAEQLPPEVQTLAEARIQARKDKNWAASDQLRDQIHALGYSVTDTPQGMKVEKK